MLLELCWYTTHANHLWYKTDIQMYIQ
jgi:hypothetical protein